MAKTLQAWVKGFLQLNYFCGMSTLTLFIGSISPQNFVVARAGAGSLCAGYRTNFQNKRKKIPTNVAAMVQSA